MANTYASCTYQLQIIISYLLNKNNAKKPNS